MAQAQRLAFAGAIDLLKLLRQTDDGDADCTGELKASCLDALRRAGVFVRNLGQDERDRGGDGNSKRESKERDCRH